MHVANYIFIKSTNKSELLTEHTEVYNFYTVSSRSRWPCGVRHIVCNLLTAGIAASNPTESM